MRAGARGSREGANKRSKPRIANPFTDERQKIAKEVASHSFRWGGARLDDLLSDANMMLLDTELKGAELSEFIKNGLNN